MARPSRKRAALLALLIANEQSLGMLNRELHALTDYTQPSVTDALRGLKAAGLVFAIEAPPWNTRYFSTAEKRDEAIPAAAALVKANQRALEAARHKRYGHKDRESKKRAAAKLELALSRRPIAPPKVKRADIPAVIPPHVQVQRLPGCPARTRFQPDVGFVGDWLKLGVGRYLEKSA